MPRKLLEDLRNKHCYRCNKLLPITEFRGLGHFKDSPLLLKSAIDYLKSQRVQENGYAEEVAHI